jgi:hypothetical protein
MGGGGRMGTRGRVLLVEGSETGVLRLVDHTSKTSNHDAFARPSEGGDTRESARSISSNGGDGEGIGWARTR